MNARLCVFGSLVLLMLAVGSRLQARVSVSEHPEAQQIHLVPEALQGYRLEHGWHQLLPGARSSIEEGALYSPMNPALAPVQLDFYRSSNVHNGAACYWAQGERLHSEKLVTVTVQGMPVVFDVASFSDGRYLRLVASTQCYADRCTDALFSGSPAAAIGGLGFKDLLSGRSDEGVVPVSLVLRSSYEDGAEPAALEAALREQFFELAPKLDLAAARKLAALQRVGG